ncbi:MAG: serine hydrolase domain-containing protein [Flavobacteriaceae bacterium]
MKIKKYWLAFLSILGVFISESSIGQNKNVKAQVSSLSKMVDSIVAHTMVQAEIPGLSIGIVQYDSILLARGYGVKNISKGNPVTKHSVFHTASISKLFTAMAIIQLVEEKKMDLGRPLIEILPKLRCAHSDCKKITVQSLLNHTSGLPDINNYNWKNYNRSKESLSNYISRLELKLQHPPFSRYLYSNLGYDILGAVIEKSVDRSFEEYIKQTILQPAEMNHSDFRYFNITDSLRTTPHTKNRLTGKVKIRKTYPYTREHAPSSTLNASTYDLCKWMIGFLKRLEEEDGYDKMLQSSFPGNPYIGLGFQLGELKGRKKVGHYGGDKGFRSYLFLIPEEKLGLVLLANCDYNEDFRQDILHTIAKVLIE